MIFSSISEVVVGEGGSNWADWCLLLLDVALEHLLECLLAHEHELVVLAQSREPLLGRQILVVLAYVEVLDVILAAILLDLVDLINDGLLMNLVRHLAVEDHFIFFVAHLVEFLVTELALTLRSHKGDLGLPQQDARVVDLLDEVLLVRMVALLRRMFLLLVEQVLCRGAGSQVLVGVSFDLS